MQEITVFVGKNVRKARIKNGMTQSELERLAGLWPGQISKIENAKCDVRINTLIKLSVKLKIHVSALFRTPY